MGIRSRFILILGLMGALAIGGIGVASYQFSIHRAKVEAKEKGNLIFSYILATRKYFKEYQRPLILSLVEQDRFYPELMSSFSITRGIYEEFDKSFPGYVFKQASLNPLIASNKADKIEAGIIATFNKNKKLTKQEAIVTKKGEKFYYLARPIVVEDWCMRCHGDPLEAPKDQVEIYGTKNGYHYKIGQTIAAFVVYIPMSQALEAALVLAGSIFAIGGGALLLSIFVTWFFLDRSVVGPIVRLSSRTVDISLGKDLDVGIKAKSKDEIGSLAQAIERLRITIVKMLKRRG